jgi:hypothetical protein
MKRAGRDPGVCGLDGTSLSLCFPRNLGLFGAQFTAGEHDILGQMLRQFRRSGWAPSRAREFIERVVASIMEKHTVQFHRPYDIVFRIKAADALRNDADDSQFPATSLLYPLIMGYNIRPND